MFAEEKEFWLLNLLLSSETLPMIVKGYGGDAGCLCKYGQGLLSPGPGAVLGERWEWAGTRQPSGNSRSKLACAPQARPPGQGLVLSTAGSVGLKEEMGQALLVTAGYGFVASQRVPFRP